MNRYDIIYEARTWIGTGYHHQGRLKGVSVDCIGLIKGVCDGIGYVVKDDLRYDHRGRGSIAVASVFEKFFDQVPIFETTLGDLMVFQLNHCEHVAIRTDAGMIHCHARMRRVVEEGVGVTWQKLLKQTWRFRGLEG